MSDAYMSAAPEGDRGTKRGRDDDTDNPQNSSTHANPQQSRQGVQDRHPVEQPGDEGARQQREGEGEEENMDLDDEMGDDEEDEEDGSEQGKRRKVTICLYRLKNDELPEDAIGFKRALYTHIRVMAFLETPTARVLSHPTEEMHAEFDERFKGIKWNQLPMPDEAPPIQDIMLSNLNKLRAKLQKSAEAHKIARLPDALIADICSTLARYGFTKWLPDIFDDPYSTYNVAHRHICLETFRRACGASQYRTLNPNLSHLSNAGLMTSLYDHYVFYMLKKNTEKELRRPGTLDQLSKESGALNRRTALAESRFRYAQSDLYPPRILHMLKNPQCHSDDECDQQDNTLVYSKNTRTGRSQRMATFFAILDARRRQVDPAEKPRRSYRQERTRVDRPTPKPSPWPMVPKDIPLDWFDPTWFNAMPVGFRVKYTQPPVIALPKNVTDETSPNDWKYLSDKNFMDEYGKDVLQEYKVPTPGEVAALSKLEATGIGKKRKDTRASHYATKTSAAARMKQKRKRRQGGIQEKVGGRSVGEGSSSKKARMDEDEGEKEWAGIDETTK